MAMVRFTAEHEWIRVEDGVGTVGITDYAQKQLGDVVFVELPALGDVVAKGTQAAVVESVKAASEVYAPASGEVIEINDALPDEPGLVNAEPMAAGWILRIRLDNEGELASLMDEEAYTALLETLA